MIPNCGLVALFSRLNDGLHDLSSKLGRGKHARHETLNDIARDLQRATILWIQELSGLSRKGGKRPDGISLIAYKTGKSVMWEVTVLNTLSLSYIPFRLQYTGNVTKVETECENLFQSHFFTLIAFKTLEPNSFKCVQFLQEFRKRIVLITCDI